MSLNIFPKLEYGIYLSLPPTRLSACLSLSLSLVSFCLMPLDYTHIHAHTTTHISDITLFGSFSNNSFLDWIRLHLAHDVKSENGNKICPHFISVAYWIDYFQEDKRLCLHIFITACLASSSNWYITDIQSTLSVVEYYITFLKVSC